MTEPAILIHSRFLVDRLSDWDTRARRIYTPDDLSDGVTPAMRDSVEILISGGEALPRSLVEALPRLRLVACFSTGYAGIDMAHLQSRGIALTTAAGINAHDVADHATALLLACWHNVPAADALVRSGGWRGGTTPRASLRGRRAGIVGLGRIGGAIATRLAAHDIDVRWWGPRAKPDAVFPRMPDLMALSSWADMLIVASRAIPENAGQIDADILRALGSNGILVNISRGFLVDEDALITALGDGTIAGAALDVFTDEPTDPARWRDLTNVVLTPHLAGYTREAGADMIAQLKENVTRYLAGAPLLSPVTDPA